MSSKNAGEVAGAIIGIGGLIWAAGMGIGLLECFKWLKNGIWSVYTVPQLLGSVGNTGWGGVDQIVQWVWMQPLWCVVAAGGMACMGIGFLIESEAR